MGSKELHWMIVRFFIGICVINLLTLIGVGQSSVKSAQTIYFAIYLMGACLFILNHWLMMKAFKQLGIEAKSQRQWRNYSIGMIVLYLAGAILWKDGILAVTEVSKTVADFLALQSTSSLFIFAEGVSAARTIKEHNDQAYERLSQQLEVKTARV